MLYNKNTGKNKIHNKNLIYIKGQQEDQVFGLKKSSNIIVQYKAIAIKHNLQ